MAYAKMILNIKWLSNLQLKQKMQYRYENGGVLWNIFKDHLSEDFTRARERNFRFLSGLQETIYPANHEDYANAMYCIDQALNAQIQIPYNRFLLPQVLHLNPEFTPPEDFHNDEDGSWTRNYAIWNVTRRI